MPVIGGKELIANFRRRLTQATRNNKISAVVGYTANYAVQVHEAPMTLKGKPRAHFGKTKKGVAFGGGTGKGRYWDPQGRAQNKFLEQPWRENQEHIRGLVKKTLIQTQNLEAALLVAALFLQRRSQELVPVDTGNLKSSAFTKIEYHSAAAAGAMK
jgi:hypothetical protein